MKQGFLTRILYGLLLAIPGILSANMSSPIRPGSATGLPFVSTHVRVLHENLGIFPDADFKTCRFEVVYDIFADSAGLSIPMLFVAEGYEDDMQIWVDGKPVKVQKAPSAYFYKEISPLTQFTETVDGQESDLQSVEIQWMEGERRSYSISDLHYFEFDLGAGAHQIKVDYTAKVWRDLGNRVADEKFLYALEPAKHWKSFGALDIQLDLQQCPHSVVTNLPAGNNTDNAKIFKWHLERLPDFPTLEIKAQPVISAFAQKMMDFGTGGFFWSTWIFLAVLHAILLWFWRKKHFTKWFSWIWLAGSVVAPLIVLIVYLASDNWIDNAIGHFASRRKGYDGLLVIFYPLFLIIHGIVLQILDALMRLYRRKQQQ